MSEGEEIEEAVNTSCCASCGIAAVDEVKLTECDGCDLVRYCSDECQENHRSEHEEACKKRATELHDELLFKQPESSYLGDCPICSLPMPLDPAKSVMFACCSKKICHGCAHAIDKREVEMRLQRTCPFCREPTSYSSARERDRQNMKRIEANDPEAMRMEGWQQHQKGKYRKAFKFYTKAAELGDFEAHCGLASLYQEGKGVQKDMEKYIHHLEKAAIAGYPLARHNLGVNEYDNGTLERAVKHWIIAATQGLDESIKKLMVMFKGGDLSKDDLAASLRAHKASVDATKSPQREEAAVFYKIMHSIS